jgi:hypothetical protein
MASVANQQQSKREGCVVPVGTIVVSVGACCCFCCAFVAVSNSVPNYLLYNMIVADCTVWEHKSS